jgi:amino acid adenylation domain-containing protein
MAADEQTGLELAIVGMAGRFPGAQTLDELWRNLREGRESVTFFTDEELELPPGQEALRHHPNYVRAAPILDGVELFDADFFGFSPRDAETTDPQHRLLLECAWEALESAGYDPERFKGLIGIYAGAVFSEYLLGLSTRPEVLRSVDSLRILFGNEKDYLATRIAYKLNLEGPALTVQTACSTSLVAVHLACQSLLSGDCDIALAGGVALKLPQHSGYLYQEGEVFSPDGHCRAFDARAQGTVFGSGVGLVVLKRLQDAITARDCIRAVIKGSAINNDGALKVGYTAPRVESQAKVIRSAQVRAEVDPATITYIEAHGTGTPMGDPIEVSALTQAFRAVTGKKGFCALGSVKTNLGHLNTASGVAGLIKTVLALEHRLIPPSLHFERPLPELSLEESPFYVPVRLTEWAADGGPRRAGVSSFGIGGTNAHVILEEAPQPPPGAGSRGWSLLTLAARSGPALERAAANLASHLEERPGLELEDAAYTLHVGRRAFSHRRAWVSRSSGAAAAALRQAARTDRPGTMTKAGPPLLFLFPGQGTQYAEMALDLYRTEPVLRDSVDRCSDLLAKPLGLDLRSVLYPRQGAEDHSGRIDQTALAQSTLFTVEYSLARLWMHWGIRPQAMIGHSLGEYVAACLAEVFSLEEALALVAARGRLMQRLPAGAMLAVPLSESRVCDLLAGDRERLSLAAVNSSRQCVVSGCEEAIDGLASSLAAEGIEGRRLRTSHAFHSAMVEPLLSSWARIVESVRLRPPQLPYLSNVTGTWIRPEEATDLHYWVRHLRETVRFSEGVGKFLEQRDGICLEVGPGRSLSNLARQNPAWGNGHSALASLPRAGEERSSTEAILTALGSLWTAGHNPDWQRFHAHERRRRVPLPSYPFERKAYWIEHREPPAQESKQDRPRKNPRLEEWFSTPSWKRTAEPEAPAVDEPGCRLLLAGEGGLPTKLRSELEARGHEVVVVRCGAGFRRSGDDEYTLDPRRREDFEELLQDLAATGRIPTAVLHLWTVDPPAGTSPPDWQALGFESLLRLVQAVGRVAPERAMRIEVISSGLQEVTGEEDLAPEKAMLLGPLKVIPYEYPRLRCRSIDIEAPSSGSPAETRLARQIAVEVSADTRDSIVAYRGRHRWVQSFEPLRLEKRENHLALRSGGVYLITGGLGGVGLTLSEHLARAVGAKLVLLGRSPIPERLEWPRMLAEGHEAAPRIRRIRSLESLGAEVLALQCDVTQPEDVRAAVAAVRDRFGVIHGVLHAAGVAGGGLIRSREAQDFERVLAPKVRGTLILAEALATFKLDFFLLCSSSLAVLGGIGQVDYCAANSFLDAFAHHHRRKGSRTVSVNWDAWQQVGMAARAAGTERREPPHPLLEQRLAQTRVTAAWATALATHRHWVLDEHRLAGQGLIPGTCYLEMMVAAVAEQTGSLSLEVRNAVFLSPLIVRDGEEREVRTLLQEEGGGFQIRVLARGSDDAWIEHASAKVVVVPAGSRRRYDPARLATLLSAALPVSGKAQEAGGLLWGPRWQGQQRVSILGPLEAFAELQLPNEFGDDVGSFYLHPALLDLATSFDGQGWDGGAFFPLSYQSLRIAGRLPGRIYSHLRRRPDDDKAGDLACFDITILNEAGEELVGIEGFTMKRVERASRVAASPSRVAGFATGHPADRGPGDGILPEEGVEACRRILARNGQPQVLVMPRDLSALLEEIGRQQAVAPTPTGTEGSLGSHHARPAIEAPYVESRSEAETILAGIWQELLGIDKVGIHDNFFELGGDSVLGIQAFARATQLGLSLTTRQLFQFQTIAELAAAAGERRTEAGSKVSAAEDGKTQSAGGSVEDSYPLSSVQQGMLFHCLAAPDAGIYLDQLSCVLGGGAVLDVDLFHQAFNKVLARHSVLRSAMIWETNGEPQQVVHRSVELPLERQDWRGVPVAERRHRLAVLLEADRARGFDLSSAPLLRAVLIREETADRFLLTYHHIILDAWSVFRIIQELFDAYESLLGKGGAWEPAPVRPYGDYIAWLRRQDLVPCEAYWRRELAGFTAPTVLGIRRAVESTAEPGSAFGRSAGRLPEAATRALQAFGRRHRLTPSTLVQGCWALLLGRYSGEEDLVYGATLSGRSPALPGLESMVGLFINTLPVRVQVQPAQQVLPWLEAFQERQFALLQFEHSPLVEVQGWSEVPRGQPLFESIVVFENVPMATGLSRPGQGIEIQEVAYTPRTNYPVALLAAMTQELSVEVLFDSRLFSAPAIARLREHLLTLLAELPTAGERRLGDLSLLGASERHQIELDWNDTLRENLPELLLPEKIAAHARYRPDSLAVRCGADTLTYGELELRSNQLAWHLRRLGAKAESRVAVALDRSIEMVVALLAILKSGAAYVPLDPEYPSDRLAYMLADSSPMALLTKRSLLASLPAVHPVSVLIDAHWSAIANGREGPLTGIEPESLAYVLYTSGSTGKPKGTQISHRALASFLRSMQDHLALEESDVLLAVTSLSFDIAGLELFLPLTAGAGVAIATHAESLDPSLLRSALQGSGATIMQATPSHWRMLLESGWEPEEGMRLLCGGEALPYDLACRLLEKQTLLWNLYGPTETTIWSSLYRVDTGRQPVPIGRPIANTGFHVLDAQLRPVPIGVPAELYISGIGLARGYLALPRQTAERFLPAVDGRAGGRMYRTGDLVRWADEGCLEYLGRIDHQVKIRGHRIELGEIEAVLQEHPAVETAAVLAIDHGAGDLRLTACVIPQPEPEGSTELESEAETRWHGLWDGVYRQPRPADEESSFNLAGWTSSYTGQPIPEEEMREWVEATVDRIASFAPRRVLEIGCGTGLLLLRLSDHCLRYWGTDFSAEALAAVERSLPSGRREVVRLLQRSADDFTAIEPGSFDAVLLNSVAQYFPGIDYFLRVVEGAVKTVAPGGFVFLGDLRSLPLLEAFHTSVQLYRAVDELPLAELRRRAQRAVTQEREMLIAPELFPALRQLWPVISRVEIRLRHGRYANELTRFRYDAILHVGPPVASSTEWVDLDWSTERFTLETFRIWLLEHRPARVRVRRIPDARSAGAVKAVRLLATEGLETVGQMREILSREATGGVDPEDLWALAGEVPYKVEVGWTGTSPDTGYDALLWLPVEDELQAWIPDEAAPQRPWSSYVNRRLPRAQHDRLEAELRSFLGRKLPSHQTPSTYRFLESFPLTPNRKINRGALRQEAMALSDSQAAPAALHNPTEELLAHLWAGVLQVPRVGSHDDFFALGGHSLLATQLFSRLRRAMGVDLTLADLFAAPTAARMASLIQAKLRGYQAPVRAIEPVPRGIGLPLSFAQQRLWFLDRLLPGDAVYNLPASILLRGPLAEAVLEKAFLEVVQRHETLRTGFVEIEQRVLQVTVPSVSLALPLVDLTATPEQSRGEEIRRIGLLQARLPFDLSRPPLIRALLVRSSPEEHALVFSVHHVVSDGWSMVILAREVAALYTALVRGVASPLPELPIQYADFAHWQQQEAKQETLHPHLRYWRQHLEGAPTLLLLPTDRPRPEVQRYLGASLCWPLRPELRMALANVERGEGVTLFMVLLAAFAILLRWFHGGEDFVIGTDVANRTRLETEGLIGFFVNQLALRVELRGCSSFRQLLELVRKVALGAYAHQDLPFEKIVHSLGLERSLTSSPLIQVKINLHNFPQPSFDLPGLSAQVMDVDFGVAQVDLSFDFVERDQGLLGFCQYRTDLFDESTIHKLSRRFEAVLEKAASQVDVSLEELHLLLEAADRREERESRERFRSSRDIALQKRLRPRPAEAASVPPERHPRREEIQGE